MIKTKEFIENIQKEKDFWLSFYKPHEILNSPIILPKETENYINLINHKVIELLAYLYENHFKQIISYLNLDIPYIPFYKSNFFHRYDLFFDKTWQGKIVEFNMDVAGWHIETILTNDLTHASTFLENFYYMFKNNLKEWNTFIVASTSYREDYKIALFIQKFLQFFLKIEAKIISPLQVEYKNKYLHTENIQIDNLIRYYPWDRFLPFNFQTKTNIINPEQSFIFQQKKIFAFMWENTNKFPENIQQTIKEIIPYSAKFINFNKEKLRKEKDKWVIKHINQREWLEIFIWEITPNIEWEKAISKASKNPENYIVQENINMISTQDNFNLNFGIYNIEFKYSWIYLRLHKKQKTDINSLIAPLKFI